MLVEFRIRNFALIDDVTVGFRPGLNVLTGETGAGKSVIVTALSLVLGARPGGPIVRAGCGSARIDAMFHCHGAGLGRLLADAGIEPEEDGSLALAREFSASGRTTARINTRAVPLSVLKAVAGHLADLHGQYAHQALLRTGDHASFLDATGAAAHGKLVQAMAAAFQNLRRIRARLRDLRDNEERIRQQADMLRFRISEIDELVSGPGEFAELRQEINTCEHAQDLAVAVHEAHTHISGGDTTAVECAALALSALEKVRGIHPGIDEVIAQLEDVGAVLETAAHTLGPLRDSFQHDPVLLEEIRDRYFHILELFKKTDSATIEDLFEYREKSSARLEEISLDEEGLCGLEAEECAAAGEAARAAAALGKSRARLAVAFGGKMRKELKELAMPGVVFEAALVPWEEGEPAGDSAAVRETGAERVVFRISPNEGEPPQPLVNIASGGELSRVMLAFKSVLRAADAVPVLVFDEIDAGIGGETAHSIARKLASLSQAKQILSVTHLPQIAAAADHHIRVEKRRLGKRTVIRAVELDGESRVREMTRMLGATGMRESEDLARKLIEKARPHFSQRNKE